MKELILKSGGQEITVYAEESELAKLAKPERARTGYERVAEGETYYRVGRGRGGACDFRYYFDTINFTNGDYVNDRELYNDRERARILHDRLEQWQALNDDPVEWHNTNKPKFEIKFDYQKNQLSIVIEYSCRVANEVYFSSYKIAQEAIKVFRDELLWYYTGYRSRLDEKRTEAAE